MTIQPKPRSPIGLRLMLVVAAGALLYLGAWSVGVTPAGQDEREFMDMLARSSLGIDARVKAVVTVADASSYVSRRHFLAAEAAFNLIQNERSALAK